MTDLVLSLLLWISSHSQLAYDSDTIPRVISVSKSELVSEMFDGKVPYALDINHVRAVGYYKFKTNTIYLLSQNDVSTTKGKSILVHELVHYLQYKHDINHAVSCRQQPEPLAYQLQSSFLTQYGLSADYGNKHIQKSGQCRI